MLAPDLIGQWKGTIHTPEGEVPFTLGVAESGEARAWVASRECLVTGLALAGEYVTGTVPAELPTRDTSRRPHHISLDLKRRGDILNGAVIAMSSSSEEGGAPEKRIGFALGHWAELRRA